MESFYDKGYHKTIVEQEEIDCEGENQIGESSGNENEKK